MNFYRNWKLETGNSKREQTAIDHKEAVCSDANSVSGVLGHRTRGPNTVPPPRTPSALSCIPSSFCTANMDHCHCRTGTESPCAYFADGGRQKDHKGGPLKVSYQCLDH
ncbi:hypothetical protein P5673_015716 [Acropora cervicornis]|uniref:Uncharacterized protein n=1 Tax=Acropora cervicornis TaxID=6130 RepID=A0AAD9V4S7_ACRCE|nr:hypothetical protein P5673_015716 [Acropora cervicornis]